MTATATVIFENSSSYDIVLTRRGDQAGTTIKQAARLSVSVSFGDVFDVTFPGQPKLSYRPIIINDLAIGKINVYSGKAPLREVGSFSTLRLLRCRPSLCGFDLTKIKPRLVLDGFLPKPVFEPLNTESISYEFQEPYFMPQGLSYQPVQLSQGSSSVKLTYSYAAFSNEWSLNVGVQGKDPTSGVGGKLDIGYKQFDNSERESKNVYASTREQKTVYRLSLAPQNAYLDPAFITAVESVTSVQDAKDKIIAQYGTHYPKTLVYGGDRSLYMSMQETVYAKAKGFGISVKAEVSQSSQQITGDKRTNKYDSQDNLTDQTREKTYGSSEVASGKLGFEYSQNEKVKEMASQTKNGYQIIGGIGGFDSWSVTDDNAVAVAIVDSDYLYNLIDPKVFKNDTSPDVLKSKKALVQQAIDTYLQDIPTLGKALPAPRTYSITLKSLEVTEEVDDANKKTKGTVTAVVSPSCVGFDGSLWNCPDFSETNLKYLKGQKVTPNTKKTLFQPPNLDGSFDPLQLVVQGDIYEQDDLIDGQQRHLGNSNSIALGDLEEGEEIQFSFDCSAFATWAARGTIRVTVAVAREASEFENPLFSSPLFSLKSNLDGQPSSTAPRLKLFSRVNSIASHPEVILEVDSGYKIIGGGARVSYNQAGNLLTASYPMDTRRWYAQSKDHQVSSVASICAYAIAIYDPKDEWDVKIFQATSAAANHPTATATVESGYVLTGGGARSNWQGAGNLLTASYPDPSDNKTNAKSWIASSKDHLAADVTTITAYAIGLKSKAGVVLSTKVFTKTSESASHPSATAVVDSSTGYTLVGGGAKANWQGGAGNLLIKSFPDNLGWKVESKDHVQSGPCTITAYAIGLKL